MMIEGDMVLTGTMNVDQTTRVEGELSGDGTMIVNGTLSIEYDVCGSVTLKADRIYIEGDVDGEVTLDAREITIEGDRGKNVKIMNAEKLVVEGEDYAEEDRREQLSQAFADAAKRSPVGRSFLSRWFHGDIKGTYNKLQSVVNVGMYHVSYEIESNGHVAIENNKAVTSGATHTIMKVKVGSYSDTVEVRGGDIDEDGMVKAVDAEIIVNGRKITRYDNAPISLREFGGQALNSAYRKREGSGGNTAQPS